VGGQWTWVDWQLMAMRDVMQGDEDNPKVPMENNCRLQMPINSRVVRTNINFQSPVISQTLNVCL